MVPEGAQTSTEAPYPPVLTTLPGAGVETVASEETQITLSSTQGRAITSFTSSAVFVAPATRTMPAFAAALIASSMEAIWEVSANSAIASGHSAGPMPRTNPYEAPGCQETDYP